MLLDLGFLVMLAFASCGLGLALLRRIGEAPEHWGDALALALPLGLGMVGLAVLGLGEVGWLGRRGVLLVLALAGVGGAWGWMAYRRKRRDPPSGTYGESSRLRAVMAWDFPLVVVLFGTLLTALAPVTDGDALCYHLQVPKVFLAAGSVGFDPDLHETVYPLLTEMLYAVALAVRGPIACRLVQWLLGVAFALNVAALARPFLGDRARWAATVALLVPAVSNGMGAPLNDVALATFGNAALFAWTRWLDRPSWRSAALSGALAGLAMGVKYPALVLAGLIALAILVHRPSRHVWLFAVAAVLVGGPWYVRAFAATGNPVYPFFRDVFGGAGLDVVLDPIKRPMAPTAWNLLTALGPMTLQPARFDSVSHQFGPLFLLVLPALVLERTPRRLWAIVAMGYAFLTLCLTQRQSMRFLLIAAGPMAVGVAWVASRWWDRRSVPSRTLVGLLVLGLAFEAAIAAGRARHGLDVVIGRETESQYLTRREPTYRVGLWIDVHLPEDSRIIGQEHRGFYLPRGYAMELAHRRRTGLGTRCESPEQVVATLRNEGFTHLLMARPEPEDAVEFDPTLGRLLGPWLDRQAPLYEERIVDPDGVARRYAIYRLDGVELARSAEEAPR